MHGTDRYVQYYCPTIVQRLKGTMTSWHARDRWLRTVRPSYNGLRQTRRYRRADQARRNTLPSSEPVSQRATNSVRARVRDAYIRAVCANDDIQTWRSPTHCRRTVDDDDDDDNGQRRRWHLPIQRYKRIIAYFLFRYWTNGWVFLLSGESGKQTAQPG